jgi:hypothetical protein
MARRVAIVVLFGLTLLAPAALAQSYPDRPIRLISPNPAGGANDTIVRIIAARMSSILGGSFIIDNRGGAGGKIGAEAVARAAPDGYTLLAGSVSTHSFAPLMPPKPGYDPIKDFEPISLFALVQNVLVVTPSLPAVSVSELIALAKAQPGKLNYASGGPGSTSHFAVAMFVALAGIQNDTVHVPYKGGRPGHDRHHRQRHPVLFRADGRHGAVHRGGLGQGAGGERRGEVAHAAAGADHGRGRDAEIQGDRLVRALGACRHAGGHRRQIERRRCRGREEPGGHHRIAGAGDRAGEQPARRLRGLRARAARAAQEARRGRRSQAQPVNSGA